MAAPAVRGMTGRAHSRCFALATGFWLALGLLGGCMPPPSPDTPPRAEHTPLDPLLRTRSQASQAAAAADAARQRSQDAVRQAMP